VVSGAAVVNGSLTEPVPVGAAVDVDVGANPLPQPATAARTPSAAATTDMHQRG